MKFSANYKGILILAVFSLSRQRSMTGHWFNMEFSAFQKGILFSEDFLSQGGLLGSYEPARQLFLIAHELFRYL